MALEQLNTGKTVNTLSNGELFLLEKTREISKLVFKELDSFGFETAVQDEYNCEVAADIFKTLPKAITLEKNMPCKEKGDRVIEVIKNKIMGDVEQLVAIALAHLGSASEREKEMIEKLTLFTEKLNIDSNTKVIKNLAWNCD